MAEGWRKPVLLAARQLGVEPALRRIQRVVMSGPARRDLRDVEHIRLLLRLSLPVDANCIDVGANVGDILREIVAIAPEGRHIAYEPLPDLAKRLSAEFPQVDVRNAAVGETSGEAAFYRIKSAHTRSSLSPRGVDPRDVEQLRVRVEALDHALEEDYSPALIKIDVEGGERGVLVGARRLLQRHRPIVIVEHGAAAHGFHPTPASDIHKLLRAAGYRIFDIDGNGPFTEAEFEQITRKGKIWTFVAHA
jgi:FkbM family methyltransferase